MNRNEKEDQGQEQQIRTRNQKQDQEQTCISKVQTRKQDGRPKTGLEPKRNLPDTRSLRSRPVDVP